jgi:hypothetical protein
MVRQLINRLVSHAHKYTATAQTPRIDITKGSFAVNDPAPEVIKEPGIRTRSASACFSQPGAAWRRRSRP